MNTVQLKHEVQEYPVAMSKLLPRVVHAEEAPRAGNGREHLIAVDAPVDAVAERRDRVVDEHLGARGRVAAALFRSAVARESVALVPFPIVRREARSPSQPRVAI